MSDNKEIKSIIEGKEVNMFTGKCRIEEDIYYLDAEYVNGKRINIPNIWLFKGEDTGIKRTGAAAAREKGNADVLYCTMDGDDLSVKGRLTIHKGTMKNVIYLSDKDTILGAKEETVEFVESLEKDPLIHQAKNKNFEPLCKVFGVMSCNEDGESRQDVIKRVINKYGKDGSWMGPGRIARPVGNNNNKTRLEVSVKGKMIGFVPDDETQMMEEYEKTRDDFVLVGLSYWPDKNIYSAKLYEPVWDKPTARMIYRVNLELQDKPSLTPPDETFDAYCLFLEERYGSTIRPYIDEKISGNEFLEWTYREIAEACENEFYDTLDSEVEPKIPTYFYFVMAAELGDSDFRDEHRFVHDADGKIMLDKNGKYIKSENYGDLGSPLGHWGEAFYRTCDKLDMQWLEDYTKSLTWYELETFYAIIESRILAMCETLDVELGKL